MKLIKIIILSSLVISANVRALDIMLSKSIKPILRQKIENDFSILENTKFSEGKSETLNVLGLTEFNTQTITDWLNLRVKYIVSENSTSTFSTIFKNNIFIDEKEITYPNALVIPYPNQDLAAVKPNIAEKKSDEKIYTILNNLGSSLYIGGKNEKAIYAMRISQGLFHQSIIVRATSARVGIIQIGEGFFNSDLFINNNVDSKANSYLRLGMLFHEARHSDGNGESLGFLHTTCPAGSDYAGELACDETTNGAYTVGAQMLLEMARACDKECSLRDVELLKLVALDSASRVLLKTHKGEKSKAWDPTPESLSETLSGAE